MRYTITIPEIRTATFTIELPDTRPHPAGYKPQHTKREVLDTLEKENPKRQLDFNNGEVWYQITEHGELLPVE